MTDQDARPEGLPADETETHPSPTPTDAKTDPVEAEDEERGIDSDAALSPVIEQQGGGALSGIGSRSADKLFKD